MGVIVQATHLQLRDYVAIKFLQPTAAEDTSASARFHREARICARLKSEHVVRILDYGVFENNIALIVMEYLRGLDLSVVVAQRGPLPLAKVVDYLLQACDAIAEAHNRGLVHRDLKPSNLFLTHRPDGTELVKVLDFGLAKRIESSDSADTLTVQTLTAANCIIGSPNYMSPEQVSNLKDIDSRTDVWSLGVILYELLTGKVPFQESTAMQTLAAILRAEPPKIRDIRPELPPLVDELLAWCLQKEPEDRCPDVISFAKRLAACMPSDTDLQAHSYLLKMKSIAPTSVATQALAIAKQRGEDDDNKQARHTWKRSTIERMPRMLPAPRAASRWIGVALGIVAGAIIGGTIVVVALRPNAKPVSAAPATPSSVASQPAGGSAEAPKLEPPVAASNSAAPVLSTPKRGQADPAQSGKTKAAVIAPSSGSTSKPGPTKNVLDDRE
jgi:serine/threonine protein kinase